MPPPLRHGPDWRGSPHPHSGRLPHRPVGRFPRCPSTRFCRLSQKIDRAPSGAAVETGVVFSRPVSSPDNLLRTPRGRSRGIEPHRQPWKARTMILNARCALGFEIHGTIQSSCRPSPWLRTCPKRCFGRLLAAKGAGAAYINTWRKGLKKNMSGCLVGDSRQRWCIRDANVWRGGLQLPVHAFRSFLVDSDTFLAILGRHRARAGAAEGCAVFKKTRCAFDNFLVSWQAFVCCRCWWEWYVCFSCFRSWYWWEKVKCLNLINCKMVNVTCFSFYTLWGLGFVVYVDIRHSYKELP